jgi:hypothetical protein
VIGKQIIGIIEGIVSHQARMGDRAKIPGHFHPYPITAITAITAIALIQSKLL